ncbi:MAG: N-acetylmuramoyl-L-alanine amidase [Lachnospiraceae bacterium]|nr:N-acetylmuramoyl-L-alanine amidase [Butyrivibrio sp.]MCM1345201.1 N-acetylmuramoyl-L-alanine amidase [Muribaculaceae bacterium]MCM1409922.1 N-acetylmuramoyl-L-alanine amidase [Lachnospiraceae bacterium]
MYGQMGRKKRYGGEVRLVRTEPFDKRMRERNAGGVNSRAGSLLRQCLVFFVTFMILLAIALAVLCMFRDSLFAPEESMTVLGEESFSVGTPQAEPPTVSANDIVVIEEEASAPVIVIDPGHGGDDDGCCRGGVSEKTVNLQIALKLAGKLEEMGYETALTREDDDTALTLEERVDIAEAASGSLYISIHQNACDEKESSINGIETWFRGCPEKAEGANWYCDCCDDSRRLAQLVQMGAVSGTGAKDRGLQQSQDLYVIRETTMPSCLIETSFLSNTAERNAIGSQEYQEQLAAGIARNIDFYFHPKTMYLTFDDGPSEENTSAVLDILQERGIKATFFVVGENVRKHPEVARRIVEEGHTIGIHCNSHDYDKVYESVEAYLADFQEAYDAVYEITGVEVELFRFPGGSINAYNKDIYEEIIQAMAERGFIYFDWNASLEDAVSSSTPEQLLQNARESTLGRKRIVMLAHDIVYNTRLCLNRLIDQFPDYEMEPLTADVMPITF